MNYITDKHTYDTGYITLADVKFESLPPTISVEGTTFFGKPEYHLSILCVEKIARLIDPAQPEQVEPRLIDAFLSFAGDNALRTFAPKNEFWHMCKDDKQSIVMMCEMPDLAEFYAQLGGAFGRELPTQPAHITLYTLQPNVGIGILSEEQLHERGSPIKMPELWEAVEVTA